MDGLWLGCSSRVGVLVMLILVILVGVVVDVVWWRVESGSTTSHEFMDSDLVDVMWVAPSRFDYGVFSI